MAHAQGKLTGEELRTRATELSGWQAVDDHHLAKTFGFPDFATALAFVNRVGETAERLGHHPDIHLSWGRVGVETWSHDTGGITERDLALAKAVDHDFGALK
jgi:4a-hydroxytetrahydrobiopterin dehydratase